MSTKNFTSSENSRQHSKFKLHTNRQQDLASQQELDDVAQKSLREIRARKQAERSRPLTEEEDTTRKLVPQLTAEKQRLKRKTKSVFHDDQAPDRDILVYESAYDSLDITKKSRNEQLQNILNQKQTDRKPSTADYTKPRVSSIGVIPIRSSDTVDGLSVLIEGSKVNATDQDVVIQHVEQANVTTDSKTTTKLLLDQPATVSGSVSQDNQKAPALLVNQGTVQSVVMTDRPPPIAKPMTKLKTPRNLQKPRPISVSSSLRSGVIVMSDDQGSKTTAKHSNANDVTRASSSHTVKSVKELLEEAKQIASPESQKLVSRRATGSTRADKLQIQSKHSTRIADKKSVSPSKSLKSNKSDHRLKSSKHDDVRQSTDRSVDEIIASLKNPNRNTQISDADRKIKEIMDKVLTKQQESDEQSDNEDEREDRGSHVSGQVLPDSDHLIPTVQIDEVQSNPKTESISAMSEAVLSDVERSFDPSPAIQEALDKLEDGSGRSVGTMGVNYEPPPSTIFTHTEDRFTVIDEQMEKYKADLLAPSDVTYEDIVGIKAAKTVLHTKPRDDSHAIPGTALLSTWQPSSKSEHVPGSVPGEHGGPHNSIHHFCTMTSDVQLPDHQRGVWRRFHVPSRFPVHYEYDGIQSESDVASVQATDENTQTKTLASDTGSQHTTVHESATQQTESNMPASIIRSHSSTDRVQSAAARNIIQTAINEGSLRDWQSKAQQIFQDSSQMELSGESCELKTDESFLYWTPAPPKWDMAPSAVKSVLYPAYESAVATAENLNKDVLQNSVLTEEDSDEDPTLEEDQLDAEDRMARERTLSRTYGSARDLTNMTRSMLKLPDQDDEELSEVGSPSIHSNRTSIMSHYTETKPQHSQRSHSSHGSEQTVKQHISFADMRAKFTEQAVIEPEKKMTDEQLFASITHKVRRYSAPAALVHDDDDFLMIYEDFNTAMEEIKKQRQQLHGGGKKADDINNSMTVDAADPTITETFTETEELKVSDQTTDLTTDEYESTQKDKNNFLATLKEERKKAEKKTPAELALEAGRAYVILPKRPKKKKARQIALDAARIESLQNFLHQEPNKLTRSQSQPKLHRIIERAIRVPQRIRHKRNSISFDTDFDYYLKKKGYRGDLNIADDKREYTRDIWNGWFNAAFPPTPVESDWSDNEEENEDDAAEDEIVEQRSGSVTSTVYSDSVELEPVLEDIEDVETVELLQEEVERLNGEIDSNNHARAFDLARRGALLRKLGKLKQAHLDLDQAILLEPMLLDAYWHRHLLFLLQNHKTLALEDLNYILKHDKRNSAAYRSRAAIFREQGEITMSIVNYTQAIKLDPSDYEAHYQRAEMYEQRGELLLAMEDYAQATKLMPSKTDALFKHGLHHFENENWQAVVTDFTELLKQEPLNARARTYRGRAYSKLKHWNPAVEDLSAAIHLDPKNWKALYYRGCILRKIQPKRALQDFSVSLLLDDSENNLLSYLHRGILYTDIGKYDDAIPDFESVLKLNKDMACAHVNLGLIYLNKLPNLHRAIKKFTAAIKADPTYLRAYICRAEAYTRLKEIKNALLDFTRAIHLRPEIHHLYMYRGQLVLQLGNLDQAAFCVRHLALLTDNVGLGQSPTQEAIVQSFLKNYDKAIAALNAATRKTPSTALYTLLGKTQMKAQYWQDAANSFQKALDLVKPWQENKSMPPEAAELFFMKGTCQVELKEYSLAHDSFNDAIKVDAKYAEAFYQRGLTRMRLKQSKGLQDFNRALAINPLLFQAFLSRAAYYGMKGQYKKAILNCNEAIKLQPKSVRAYLYRGSLKYHIKAYALAIRDLTCATTINNHCALAYFNRAICHQDSGSYNKALQDYGIVMLSGDELHLKVLINRGLLYYTMKDYRNALYDLLLAAKVHPNDQRIHHQLGLCYHKLGELERAVRSFTVSMQLDPFFLDALIARGNVFMDFAHEIGLTYARRDYQRCLHMNALYLPARVNLAYTLQMVGHYQQAWHQFTAAINIDNSFQAALEGRAIINLQMSDFFAALQDINASLDVCTTAELYTNRGVIHQFLNDTKNAMSDFQSALKEDTTYSLAYFNAANLYFHMRRFKQALGYYNSSLMYNKSDESAYLNRAICKVLLKDTNGALIDFNKAIKLSPYSAHVYFNRGNLYASINSLEDADNDYTKALELQPDDALVLKRRADVRGKLQLKELAIEDYKRAILIHNYRKQQAAKDH